MNTIKYYRIGYGSPEDSYYEILTHTKIFTEEDIENMMVEYITKNKRYPYKRHFWENKFDSIVYKFINFLCKKKGFKKLEYTSQFCRFGWASVFDKNDWDKSERGKLDNLTDKILKTKEKKQQ